MSDLGNHTCSTFDPDGDATPAVLPAGCPLRCKSQANIAWNWGEDSGRIGPLEGSIYTWTNGRDKLSAPRSLPNSC